MGLQRDDHPVHAEVGGGVQVVGLAAIVAGLVCGVEAELQGIDRAEDGEVMPYPLVADVAVFGQINIHGAGGGVAHLAGDCHLEPVVCSERVCAHAAIAHGEVSVGAIGEVRPFHGGGVFQGDDGVAVGAVGVAGQVGVACLPPSGDGAAVGVAVGLHVGFVRIGEAPSEVIAGCRHVVVERGGAAGVGEGAFVIERAIGEVGFGTH